MNMIRSEITLLLSDFTTLLLCFHMQTLSEILGTTSEPLNKILFTIDKSSSVVELLCFHKQTLSEILEMSQNWSIKFYLQSSSVVELPCSWVISQHCCCVFISRPSVKFQKQLQNRSIKILFTSDKTENKQKQPHKIHTHMYVRRVTPNRTARVVRT